MTSWDDPPRAWWASVHCSRDFILIRTESGYWSSTTDYHGAKHYLAPDASDEQLGWALLDALAQSRFLEPGDDGGDLFDVRKAEARWAAWLAELVERYGYASKRQALKDLALCLVKRVSDEIAIEPTQHAKREEWEGLGADQAVRVAVQSPPASVGAALRLALSRCF